MPSRGPWIDHFGENFLWSNATLILKGMAPYGTVSLEEIDRACEKLRVREGEPDRGKAWFEEWRALGDLIEKRGDDALAKGRKTQPATTFFAPASTTTTPSDSS